MAGNYDRRINIWINGKQVKNEIADIKNAMTKLVNEQARMTVGSQEYIAHAQKIRQLKGYIQEHNDALKVTTGSWLSLKNAAAKMNQYFTLITAGLATVTGVFFSLKQMLTGNAALSDSMADVAKSTNLTMTEVKEMNKELRKIDTRTGRKELLDLAYVAGKLGYSSKSDVIGFVRAADQIGVALSKDLGGNVEDAVNNLGKITDLFKIKQQYGIEQAMLKAGSAINALGAASSASESYIVDFTKRLGGIAPMAGFTVEQVMGLGATLDQLGQQAETSSTAISQVITKVFKDPAKFAKAAGIDVKEFSDLIKTDANAALIMFLKGLQQNKGGLTELAQKFGDLGVDGTRSIGVIGALANNIDILTKSQDLSNKEFAKGTSLTNEYNIKNNNMASNLEKVGRGLRAAFVNSDVMSGLEKIVGWMASWFKIPLADKLRDEQKQVNLLTLRLMDHNLPAATRNKLYNELKGLAPKVVEGINSEAISYVTLRKNLEAYNKELIRKIAVANADELVTDAGGDAAKWLTKRTELEDQILMTMQRGAASIKTFNADIGKDLEDAVYSPYLTFQQKFRIFWREIDKNKGKVNLGGWIMDEDKYKSNYEMYLHYLGKEEEATKEVNALQAKRDKLAEGLTNTINSVTYAVSSGTSAITDDTENTLANANAKEKAVTAWEKFNKQIQELQTLYDNQVFEGNPAQAATLTKLNELKTKAEEVKAIIDAYQNVQKVDIEDTIPGLDAETKDITDELAANAEKELAIIDEKYKAELDLFKEMNDQKLDLEREYQDKKKAFQEEAINTSARLFQFAAEAQYNHDIDALDQKYTTEEQKLKDALTNKLISQAQYDAETTKLSKKRAEEEVKIRKRQAKIEKTIASLEIGAEAAKTIFEIKAKAAAYLANVVTAPLAALALSQIPLVLASAALQTGLVWAQPENFWSGGYTGPGRKKEFAGVVHKKEYVVPEEGTSNPDVRRVLDVFELNRQQGNLPRLRTKDIIDSISSTGFVKGGYGSSRTSIKAVTPGASTSTLPVEQIVARILQEFMGPISRLNEILGNGIESTVVLRGKNGLYDKMKEDDLLSNNASD